MSPVQKKKREIKLKNENTNIYIKNKISEKAITSLF